MKLSVRDDPKLLDDSGDAPKQKGAVGGSIPSCEIISLLDGKLVRWSNASYVPKGKVDFVLILLIVLEVHMNFLTILQSEDLFSFM